ncbi:ketosteroid isomerase-like protein [Constrictibacter sp. MBR-5]|jgi:ketosteroid isomerase-like protein|uniref:nuclear transport factor 2 family protein n=1 Tax=Constrictibacter sp. MBR-5 TaxID=3156467 RepID=UPI0033919733
MSDAASDLIDRYIAAWNETDAGRRRDLIARTWTEDATYVDPLMRGDGAAGIDAMIAGVQAQFPGWRFARLGTVDAHGDRVRFAWVLGPANADAPIAGTDFAVLSPDGRLAAVTGFIDRMPAAA